MKCTPIKNAAGKVIRYMIYCPACEYHHPFSVDPEGHPRGIVWEFNGDTERPTFTPSLLVEPNCHSQVTNGQIHFYTDSKHAMAGKTVPLPDCDL